MSDSAECRRWTRRMGRLVSPVKERWLALFGFMLLLATYHLIFGQFFPTRNGTLGHDYSRILPDLLDGYFWFRSNGIFEPFWFTPAFCGGQPAFGAPESGIYSFAQFLNLFAAPLASVYATVLLFASLGFWGFYLLLSSCFGSSRQAAVLGGALFMLNGFFIHRMLIGHFAFHGVMLIPWIAYFLLRPVGRGVFATMLNGAAAGCMVAYGTYSGMVHLLLPCAFAVLGIASIHGLARRESTGFVYRSLFAALVASGLSAAKLTAALLFLRNFPRSDYSLPGISYIPDAVQLLFSTLFVSSADIAEQVLPLLDNVQWELGRHEWEYGVTWVPLIIILAGAAVMFGRIRNVRPRLSLIGWAWFAPLGFVLAVPFALNIYTPDWNDFLKQIPVIKSSIYMPRWFLVYIPLVVLTSALLMDRISPHASSRSFILLAALVALIWINAVKDRDFYHEQPYRPYVIDNAWRVVKASTAPLRIQNVSAFLDADNQVGMTNNRNDKIATGESQLACNNPIFGYRLEHFPLKSLHLGPVLAERDGLLNIKNPACYTYPEQNNCTPGDHFTIGQREAARAFASYKPFSFNLPPEQKIANWMTLMTLAFLAVLFVVALSLSKRLNPQPKEVKCQQAKQEIERHE